jgi:hypothetical protein
MFGEKIDRLGDSVVRFYRYDCADHHIHCVHGGTSLEELLKDSPSRPRRILRTKPSYKKPLYLHFCDTSAFAVTRDDRSPFRTVGRWHAPYGRNEPLPNADGPMPVGWCFQP